MTERNQGQGSNAIFTTIEVNIFYNNCMGHCMNLELHDLIFMQAEVIARGWSREAHHLQLHIDKCSENLVGLKLRLQMAAIAHAEPGEVIDLDALISKFDFSDPQAKVVDMHNEVENYAQAYAYTQRQVAIARMNLQCASIAAEGETEIIMDFRRSIGQDPVTAHDMTCRKLERMKRFQDTFWQANLEVTQLYNEKAKPNWKPWECSCSELDERYF